MFVRVKTTPNSPRKSIQICENVRVNGKVKQKILRYIGIAMNEREEEKLKDLAAETASIMQTERVNEAKQKSLFSADAGDFKNKKAGRQKKKPLKILKDIVLARLESPASKHRTQKNLEKYFGKSHDLDAIYRMMDNLFEKIDDVKKLTFLKTKSLFPEKLDLLLFDVTTLYFESTNVDDLRNFGYSKDHRFNTTQVVLALATNQDGLPIGYELFEGNKAEVKTLLAAIESWKKLFSIESVCFVGDRAMFTKKNMELLKTHQYHYNIAAKLKKLPGKLQEKIFNED